MDPNFPTGLDIRPFQLASNVIAQDIKKYGLAGRVWEAAPLLVQYLSCTDPARYDPPPPFCLVTSPETILEIGAGTGYVALSLSPQISHLPIQIITTDLPEVVSLLDDNINTSNAANVLARPLSWGNNSHFSQIRAEFGQPKVLLFSDCVYFNELFEPLLKTLIFATEGEKPPVIIASYRVRMLAKEQIFWNAFGYWFDFEPVFSKAGLRLGGGQEDELYVFVAHRRENTKGHEFTKGNLLSLQNDTFERILMLGMGIYE